MLECSTQLTVSLVFSMAAYRITRSAIPRFRDMFIRAHLVGVDQAKKDRRHIPEAMGVIAGGVFLVTMFVFMVVPFLDYWQVSRDHLSLPVPGAPFDQRTFSAMTAALLSICCMLLLGFVDDVLDLRWRHKLLLPTIACIPLLVVHVVEYNVTTVVVPKPLRSLIGSTLLDLGPAYYVYMAMLCIFCTNAINILAGINGLEVGQSVLIALSILVFNGIELHGDCWRAHLFSANLLMPFLGVSFALLSYNWFPASVFIGDTYCYFAGMTFAVVAIIGHFSKTMLLFFLPQIFNFLFSVPQLFHLVECPRHRMPTYDAENDILRPSTFSYVPSRTRILGRLVVNVYARLGLIHLQEEVEEEDKSVVAGDHPPSSSSSSSSSTSSTDASSISHPQTQPPDPASKQSDGRRERRYRATNCTLINLMLILFKPMRENNLTTCILVLQLLSSLSAFFVRYAISRFVY